MTRTIYRLTRLLHNCRHNIHIARGARIHPKATLSTEAGGSIRVGRASIHLGAYIATHGGDVIIGDGSSVNPYCVLYGHGGLTIGQEVRIATHSVVVSSNHTFGDHSVPIGRQPLSAKGIRIEDDVWIGAGVKILDGVVIGSGCVVGAGSVVTRSLEPNGIYVGAPARRIRSR
jgi:acetyltransferase-like isoleucine patch superfamily enzyme